MRFDLSDDEWALLEPLLPKSREDVVAFPNGRAGILINDRFKTRELI